MSRPHPTDIKLHQKSRLFEITFDTGETFNLTAEFLRVHSPSAEVQGHGPGQEVLQIGKETVNISNIEQVGNYAVRLVFDDGHDSGIFSWQELYRLGTNASDLYANYLRRLAEAGHSHGSVAGNGADAPAATPAGSSTVIKI